MIAQLYRFWFTLLPRFLFLFVLANSSMLLEAQTAVWQPVVNFEGRDILFLYNDEDIQLYAGVGADGLVKSTDLGKTWERINAEGHFFTPSSLYKDDEQYYLTTLDKGVFASKNGVDFTHISTTLPRVAVWGITRYAGDLYISTSAGVYRQDKKAIWVKEALPDTYQDETLFDIYAKAGLLITGGKDRLYIKRLDSWETVAFDFGFDIRNIVIFDNKTIWVGTNGKGGYYSDDQGQTWLQLEKEGLGGNVIFLSKQEEKDMLRISGDGIYQDAAKVSVQPEGAFFKTATIHRSVYFAGTVDAGIFSLNLPAGGKSPAISTDLNPIQSISKLQIFPNPTTGKMWVELSTEGKKTEAFEMEIYDMSGQLVAYRSILSNEQSRFDLNLAPGHYLVIFAQGGRPVQQTKLVIGK